MTKIRRFAILIITLIAIILVMASQFSQKAQAAQTSLNGTWTITSSMTDARNYHTATLLKNGLVLVAGGWDGGSFIATAELYHPKTGQWTSTGSMNVAR